MRRVEAWLEAASGCRVGGGLSRRLRNAEDRRSDLTTRKEETISARRRGGVGVAPARHAAYTGEQGGGGGGGVGGVFSKSPSQATRILGTSDDPTTA
ncbi:unnamed protein product [Parajaminaea phylloscopi]